jgi:hypothetical protein
MDAKNYARPLLLLLVCLLAGCDPAPVVPEPDPPAPPDETGTLFEPATTGSIFGQVIWDGEVPDVPPYRVAPFMSTNPALNKPLVKPNPNAPAIDPDSHGIGSALVFLRGIDPRRGRPWDLPPVEVELKDLHLQVVQGGPPGRFGIVRRGDNIRMVSRQPVLYSLHADGAAFFTLPFPDPDRPLTRRLPVRGVVELTDASFYWMRSYLFIDEHPYYCPADARGNFTLPQVPAGDYQLVCWLPSWIERERHLDPDSYQPVRIYYAAPLEKIERVTIQTGMTTPVKFRVSAKDFEANRPRKSGF